MRWSEDQTVQFVEIYLKRVHLWNPKHQDYKTMNLRMKSYQDMISEFREATGINLNLVELKIKIKNLRSTYTQELAKIRRRSSPECAFKSNLKWFTLWHKCFANVMKEEVETSYDQQDPIEDPSEVWDSHTNNLDPNIDPFQDSEVYNNIVIKVEPNDLYNIQNSNQCKVKKKKGKLRSPSVQFSDRTYRGSMDSSDSTKEDEFDIYGKYIASQLRKMDVQKALKVQLEIQGLVSEARILDLTNKH